MDTTKQTDIAAPPAPGPVVAVPAGSPSGLRALSPAQLRRAASVEPQEALRLWTHALGRGGATTALVSLLEDWSEWSGMTYPDMLQTIMEAQEKVNREWDEQRPEAPEEVAAFYDATDTLIPLLLWWHGTTPRPARCAATAASVIGAAGGRRVLDFGCGIGSTSLLLASQGLEPVLSEVSRETMRFAEWRLRQRGLDPSTIDLRSRTLADLPTCFVDGIVAFDVFEHLPNLNETLGELDRLLQPGGVLCFNQIFIPEEREEPQHYPLRGEALLWFHRRGYRLTHVIDVCWVAQKAPLGPRERLAQSLSLRGRIAAARLVEQRRGPIGRRVAFHTIRHVIA